MSDRTARLRLWPLALIAVLAAIAVAYVRLSSFETEQERVVSTFAIGFSAFVAVVVWAFLFSRGSWRFRIGVPVALVLGATALAASLEVRDMSGDFVPTLAFRWTPDASTPDSPPAAPAVSGAPIERLSGDGDWPGFLGPRRYPQAPEGTVLRTAWEGDPPREVWRRPVGAGWSSFAVANGIAVTQEQRGPRETVAAYVLATGEPLWVHGYEARYETAIAGEGPRATPSIDDGRVYALGATGVLSALELRTGEPVWTRDTVREDDARVPEWGMTGSPLVVDLPADRNRPATRAVVVNIGAGRGRALAAYDAETGERFWAAGDDPMSYGSPALVRLAGVRQVVQLNDGSITGHDLATGDVLWRHPWATSYPKVAVPIAVGDDRLLVTSGYGAGVASIEVSNSSGDWTTRELWATKALKAKFTNVVVRDGFAYGLDDGILVCVDLATGERVWKGGRYGHGQNILFGDRLLVTTEKGGLAVVLASPGGHRELARLDVFDHKQWNAPALAGRYLLLRTHREATLLELPLHRG